MEIKNSLLNKTILITRQPGVAKDLCEEIMALGGQTINFPLFAVESLLTAEYRLQINQKIAECALAVCVSRNAANLLNQFNNIQEKTWATIGPNTASSLQSIGIRHLLYPNQPPYDSKGLVDILNRQQVKLRNQYIIVLTGEQGDVWLQNALEKQGAKVEVLPIYRRIMPIQAFAEIKDIFSSAHKFDIILITCITSLANLIQMSESSNIKIRQIPILVVSDRIRKYAVNQGFEKIYTAASMSDADILSTLLNI